MDMIGDLESPVLSTTQFCRFCFEEKEFYVSLWETKTLQMHKSLTSIEICCDDAAPKLSCLQCFTDLENAYKIQQKLRKSEETFRRLLQTGENTDLSDSSPKRVCTKLHPFKTKMQIFEEILSDVIVKLEDPKLESTKRLAPESSLNDVTIEPETIKVEEMTENLDKVISDAENVLAQQTQIVTEIECKLCAQVFLLDDYKIHYEEHKNGLCAFCGSSYKNRKSLRNHVLQYHCDSPKSCEECSMQFNTKLQYTNHMRNFHTGETPFVCERCGLKFVSTARLRLHMRNKHVFDPQYECDVCQKRFGYSSFLNRHRANHANDKKYICEFCGVGFSVSCNLKQHKKKQHGWREEENFKCVKCEKWFATQHALTIHLHVHNSK